MTNKVMITFAGDEKDLDRAIKSSITALDKQGQAFDKAGANAAAYSNRIEHVADASDEVNNLGDKATSSLGALSSGFELLGDRGETGAKALMTAALATDFLSGASEAGVIVTKTFRDVMDKAKAASAGFTAALKNNAGQIAATAAGVTAAVALIGVFVLRQKAAADSVRSVADALDYQSGKFTANNRAAIQKKLADDGLIESAAKYGLTVDDLTDAVLGNAEAMDRVKRATDTSVQGLGRATSEQNKLVSEVRAFADNVATAEGRQLLMNQANADGADAMEAQRKATDDARKAMEDYSKAIQDQFDPMANLVHRLEDVRARQADYNQAVKEHGKNSAEARAASLALGEAIIAADGAAAGAAGTFNGQLSPALLDTLRRGGATEQQIRDIEAAFKAAEKAGNHYARTYTAKAVLDTKELFGSLAAARNALQGSDYVSGRASGGPTMPGKAYKVGEAGEELWVEQKPGYMFNAAQTAAILSGGYAGASAGPAMAMAGGGRIVLEVRAGGGRTDDILYQLIEHGLSTGRLTIRASQIQAGR